ncbi:MAG: hypothetical protein ACI9BF_000713 [Candidatus Paceibacteria bacterium]|jgi:hypothetical protein
MRAVSLYTFVIFSFMQGWPLLTFFLVIIFSLWHNPATFIPLAILMDGYFGNFASVPTLSILAVGWFVATEYIRPRITNLRNV